MSERNERPTPRRLREARRRGDVPRSQLLGASAGALAATLAAAMAWPVSVLALRTWTGTMLEVDPHRFEPTLALAAAASLVARVSAPVLVGGWVGAWLAGLAVGGLHVDLSLLRPRTDRLSPLRQLARRFSPAALVDAVRPVVLLLLLGGVAWASFPSTMHQALTAIARDDGFVRVALRLGRLGCTLAVVTALAGVADALLARHRHQARLRMTRREVLEEHRQTEGDPRSKARRKALHRSLLLAGRARGVRNAQVLVVNPTHLAVALRYSPLENEAPYLVAKGRGARAQALRREAEHWAIPVVRDVPLARSLVDYDVGEEIPEELYQAAAAVLEVVARTERGPAAGGDG